MSARVRRKRVGGDGGVVQRVARRRNEDDGVASLDARDDLRANALNFATQRGGGTLTDLLGRADTATRARTIIGLQRVKGNAHVQRLLQREDGFALAPAGPADPAHGAVLAVQREPAAAPALKSVRFKDDTNLQDVQQKKLVLDSNKNSGQYVASIRTLQDALDEAGFKIKAGSTGFYGVQTTKAVADFQNSLGLVADGRVGANTLRELDEKFAPKTDPTPVPPGPLPGPLPVPPIPPGPLPGPQPGPLDLKTVAALNATLVQYQFLLTRQRDALQAVRRDLTNLDRPKAPFVQAIVKQALESFVGFYFGGAGSVLVQAIEKQLHLAGPSEEAEKVIEEANLKLFESLKFQEQTVKAIEDPEDPLATLDEWFDLRLAELTKKGFRLQLAFVHEVTPQVLLHPAIDVDVWTKSVEKVADETYQRQFDQELVDWATYQVQAGQADKQKTKKGGVDLSDVKEDTAGLLELKLHGGSPEKNFPMSIESARIVGLSLRTRRRLGKRTIGQLAAQPGNTVENPFPTTGIPIAGRGTIVAQGEEGRGNIKIGRNDHGEFFSWEKEKRGDRWLRLKAAVQDKPDLSFVSEEEIANTKPEEGARLVFERDLNPVVLKNVEGFLDDA